MKININPRRVTQILLLVVAVLVTLSVAGQCYRYFIGNDPSILKIVGKVDLDGEGDCLPTWYQICSLFFCFILLTVITLGKRAAQESWVKHWGFLALTFLFLSLDEAISLHEQLSKLGKQVKATGGVHDFWVIPALLVVSLFGLSYLRFLWRLPFTTRWLMIFAGVVYVSGAAGMEIISGHYLETHQASLINGENFTYKMLDTIEETLEMLGIAMFIHANLSYLAHTAEELEIAGKETFAFSPGITLATQTHAYNAIVKS